MKALTGAFNQDKALVGAFSVIAQLHRLIVYTALIKFYPPSVSSNVAIVDFPSRVLALKWIISEFYFVLFKKFQVKSFLVLFSKYKEKSFLLFS